MATQTVTKPTESGRKFRFWLRSASNSLSYPRNPSSQVTQFILSKCSQIPCWATLRNTHVNTRSWNPLWARMPKGCLETQPWRFGLVLVIGKGWETGLCRNITNLTQTFSEILSLTTHIIGITFLSCFQEDIHRLWKLRKNFLDSKLCFRAPGILHVYDVPFAWGFPTLKFVN